MWLHSYIFFNFYYYEGRPQKYLQHDIVIPLSKIDQYYLLLQSDAIHKLLRLITDWKCDFEIRAKIYNLETCEGHVLDFLKVGKKFDTFISGHITKVYKFDLQSYQQRVGPKVAKYLIEKTHE